MSDLADYENRLDKVVTDLTVLKWMVGTNIVLTLAVFVRLFTLP